RFYRHLLAERAGHSVESALALARNELAIDRRAGEHHAVDHATPLVFGAGSMCFAPKAGKSAQSGRRDPRPQPLLAGSRDLDRPHNFVGRGAELTRLQWDWLESASTPVALLQGLAGL